MSQCSELLPAHSLPAPPPPCRFLAHMRLNSSWYQGFVLIGRWLAFRLDLISATTLAGGALMGAALRGRVPVSLLGLALSYVLQLPGLMQWTVRQSTEVGGHWGAVGELLGRCCRHGAMHEMVDDCGLHTIVGHGPGRCLFS